MKILSSLLFALMAVSGLALAQEAPLTGIAETTDAAKIAQIEQHAQELAANPPPATAAVVSHKVAHAKHAHKAKAKPAAEAAPTAAATKG